LKILIIENEVYLAQSIATKLGELGHICEMCTSTRDAIKSNNYDVVLLSTNINGQDFNPVIETFKKSIVILMVSYISNELKNKNEAYDKYLTHTFASLTGEHNFSNINFPLFISSSYQKHSDSFAFEYAKDNNETLHFVSLSNPKAMAEIEAYSTNSLIYIIDFQTLKKGDIKTFYELVADKKVIISTTDKIEDEELNILEIKSENNIFDQGEILPIEDYVKFIVLNYQHKFPDTELSKKLGISRKSLWEKRKKYDIVKKK